MLNSENNFYGEQTDEHILYVVHPHPLATTIGLIKIYAIALVISVVLVILGSVVNSLMGMFNLLALIIFFVVAALGTKIILDWQKRNISYITDRRIVRFEPTTLFATNSRALTWDEVVKVKTYPPNFIWKQLAIGNVVVHARTSVTTVENEKSVVTADDIQLNDVYFYRDLGNYIDKILFTYKVKPKEVSEIKPFVPMPRGQRY